jgi:hypothetical protein
MPGTLDQLVLPQRIAKERDGALVGPSVISAAQVSEVTEQW